MKVYIISHIASGAVHRRQVRARDAEERRHDGPRAGHGGMTADDGAAARRDRSALDGAARPARLLLDDVSSARRAAARIHVVVGPERRRQEHAAVGAARPDRRSTGAIVAALARRRRASATCRRASRSIRTLPVTVEDFLALTRQRRPVCFGVDARRRGARSRAARARRPARASSAGRSSVLSGGELRRVLLAHALDPMPGAAAARRAGERPRRSGRRAARGDAAATLKRRPARPC